MPNQINDLKHFYLLPYDKLNEILEFCNLGSNSLKTFNDMLYGREYSKNNLDSSQIKLFDYLTKGGSFVAESLKAYFGNKAGGKNQLKGLLESLFERDSNNKLKVLLEFLSKRDSVRQYVDELSPENFDNANPDIILSTPNFKKLKLKSDALIKSFLEESIKNRASYVSEYLLDEKSINGIKASDLLEYINIIKEKEYSALWKKIEKDIENKLFEYNKENIYSGDKLLIHNLDKLLKETFIRKIWQPNILNYIYNDENHDNLNALKKCYNKNIETNDKNILISVFSGHNKISDLDHIKENKDNKIILENLFSELAKFRLVDKLDHKEFKFIIDAINDKFEYRKDDFDVDDFDVSNINNDDLSNLIAKLNLYEDCLNDLIAQELDRNSMSDNDDGSSYAKNKRYLDKYGKQLTFKDRKYITDNLFELSVMSFIDEYPEIKQVVDKNKKGISFREMIVVSKLKDLLLCIDDKLKASMRKKLPEFVTVRYKQAAQVENPARKRSSIKEFFIKNQNKFRNLAIVATSILALYNGVTLALGLNVYVLMLSMSSLSANLLAAAIANIACISTTTISCFVYAASYSIAYRASSSAGPNISSSEGCSSLQKKL